MTISELLDRAKEHAQLKSDYALAKVLGVPNGYIADYRRAKRHPSNEDAVKLATLAGLDEMRVIAEIELQTANSEKKKQFWKHYIESRGITACLAMTAIAVTITIMPDRAHAEGILQLQDYAHPVTPFAQQEYTLCARSIRYNRLIIMALLCNVELWLRTVVPTSLPRGRENCRRQDRGNWPPKPLALP